MVINIASIRLIISGCLIGKAVLIALVYEDTATPSIRETSKLTRVRRREHSGPLIIHQTKAVNEGDLLLSLRVYLQKQVLLLSLRVYLQKQDLLLSSRFYLKKQDQTVCFHLAKY